MARQIIIGTWLHVALSWSRENRTGKLYINGTETGSKEAHQLKSVDLNPTGHKEFDIGLKRDSPAGRDTLHGYLRDLLVTEHAVSNEEVKRISQVV